ncbi:hypothetical protein ACFFX0_30480 [Citricoccus parietis]|uniref:Uncharacterized protein n=1 Tax=Citricoccus parietis TaxID=592307 RepID=A0ABV5G8H6_9MICC
MTHSRTDHRPGFARRWWLLGRGYRVEWASSASSTCWFPRRRIPLTAPRSSCTGHRRHGAPPPG